MRYLVNNAALVKVRLSGRVGLLLPFRNANTFPLCTLILHLSYGWNVVINIANSHFGHVVCVHNKLKLILKELQNTAPSSCLSCRHINDKHSSKLDKVFITIRYENYKLRR